MNQIHLGIEETKTGKWSVSLWWHSGNFARNFRVKSATPKKFDSYDTAVAWADSVFLEPENFVYAVGDLSTGTSLSNERATNMCLYQPIWERKSV
jgi:hypothetical protein